jgi:hypothetical protein
MLPGGAYRRLWPALKATAPPAPQGTNEMFEVLKTSEQWIMTSFFTDSLNRRIVKSLYDNRSLPFGIMGVPSRQTSVSPNSLFYSPTTCRFDFRRGKKANEVCSLRQSLQSCRVIVSSQGLVAQFTDCSTRNNSLRDMMGAPPLRSKGQNFSQRYCSVFA